MSPVRKPWTQLLALARERGKPCSSINTIWRRWRPVAVMKSGMTRSTCSTAGVLAPTAAASIQWDLGSPSLVRFHFVLPPLRHARGILTVHDLAFLMRPDCADSRLRAYLERLRGEAERRALDEHRRGQDRRTA